MTPVRRLLIAVTVVIAAAIGLSTVRSGPPAAAVTVIPGYNATLEIVDWGRCVIGTGQTQGTVYRCYPRRGSKPITKVAPHGYVWVRQGPAIWKVREDPPRANLATLIVGGLSLNIKIVPVDIPFPI